MIYLKQVKLLDPDLVAGNPEELKYPYKAPAVRFTESFIFHKPVTFLVGENGAGKSTLLEAMMSKYEEKDEEEPGMLYDGTEAYKIYANVLPEHIKLIETRKPEKHFFFRAESFLTMRPNWIGKPNWNYVSTARSTPIKLTVAGVYWSNRTARAFSALS